MGINTPEFSQFVQKRKEWTECLNGKDCNSIWQQIIRMTWNAAAFRIVNEARRLAPPDADGGVQLNGMVNQLLDQCFSQSHMVAIRRLTDPGGLSGKRGVFSLVSLIKDIEDFRGLVTREHLLEAEGLKYEYEDVKLKLIEYQQQQLANGKRAYCVPQELVWGRYEERHGNIDRLCSVRVDARQRCDTIQPRMLEYLKRRLRDECDELDTHVNKFIAHGATPGSRAIVGADLATPTFGHLWSAHRALCQVASFVSVHLLGGASLHPLAFPQHDQFAYVDRSLVTESNLGVLRQSWDVFDRETHDWGNWGLNELEKEMTAARPRQTLSTNPNSKATY